MTIPFRQVHLDCHTSGLIKNMGKSFNKEQFQNALKVGNVNSITVFSKCHHGWAYHPTKVHKTHPTLEFDLLKAQLDACNEMGVQAPVYISAGVDEKEAVNHPEWLVRNADESVSWTKDFTSKGGYHLLCYNTPYLDLLLKQIEEVVINYNPVGIFLDISSIHPCYCSKCRNDLLAMGKDPRDFSAVMELAEKVYANYTVKVEELIHSYNKETRIFHNSGHITRGRRDISGYNTHLELESLPTGGWGYDHFPMSASYVMNLGVEYLGMTGKFHGSWGEFGGFKHPNALRYETSLSLAFGAKCSIGDQLHPFGDMDMGTYELIGKAYGEVKEKEEYCVDAVNLADIAILSQEAVASATNRDLGSYGDVGANRIMLEAKYLYRIIDREVDLNKFKLLILPDTIRLDEVLQNKIETFIEKGGKVLATGKSALKKDSDDFAIDLGVKYLGENVICPSYIRPNFNVTNGNTAYVMYSQGYNIEVKSGKKLATREDSFFNRDVYAFSSHQHTPNNPEAVGCGVVVNDNTAYIPWDIFSEYGKKGSYHLKEIIITVIDMLLGDSKTISMDFVDRGVTTLTHQESKGRYINHLLFAHTSVRGESVEVIESIIPVYNVPVTVQLSEKIKRVYIANENKEISFTQNNNKITYTVPEVNCHCMVVMEY